MRFLRHRIHVIGFSLLACILFSVEAFAQSTPEDLQTVLGEEILAPSAALSQMKSFILSRVAPPPVATSAAQWTEESQRLRRHLLQDVVFHGWPPEWVNSSANHSQRNTNRFADFSTGKCGVHTTLRDFRANAWRRSHSPSKSR